MLTYKQRREYTGSARKENASIGLSALMTDSKETGMSSSSSLKKESILSADFTLLKIWYII
jgi:hypothetical protein